MTLNSQNNNWKKEKNYFPGGDPYWRCSDPPQPEGVSNPKQSFVGYLSSEASMLMTSHLWSSNDGKGSSDYLGKDSHPGAYGIDVRHINPETGVGGLKRGTSIRGYPSPLRDPSSLGLASHSSPRIHDNIFDRPSSLRRINGLPVMEENQTFFLLMGFQLTVQEESHLFRPFIGFRELRVVHKEPRYSGDKARVLCFIELADANCALTAMKPFNVQYIAFCYKFDDKKPDSLSEASIWPLVLSVYHLIKMINSLEVCGDIAEVLRR